MGEKIFIGAETINPLQKVVLEELGVARQDNRTNRRARDLLCRGRVRPRRLGLSKVVDVVSNTNHADGQLARANYGRADTTPATVGRGDPTAPQSEDFLWDGLALIQRGDEHFINEPHIGNAPKKLCFGGEPRAKRSARRVRKGPRGNPVASSKGTSYFNDALGTTIGSKKDGKYSAAALTAFGESLETLQGEVTSNFKHQTSNSNFFTGKPFVEGLGHAFLMRNYRAGLAKWQTADPMGYPDGWNQLAYCGNRANIFVDKFGMWATGVAYAINDNDVPWYLSSHRNQDNDKSWANKSDNYFAMSGEPLSQALVEYAQTQTGVTATDFPVDSKYFPQIEADSGFAAVRTYVASKMRGVSQRICHLLKENRSFSNDFGFQGSKPFNSWSNILFGW